MNETRQLLQKHFKYLANDDPISLQTINQECEVEPELLPAVNHHLNFYEVIAVGVRHGVYDEGIIKSTYSYVMTACYRQFYAYIADRRLKGVVDFASEVETLVQKWQSPALQQRPLTGT